MDLKSKYTNSIEFGKKYQDVIFAVLILILAFSAGLGLGLLIRPKNPAPIIIDKNVKIGLPAGRQGLPKNIPIGENGGLDSAKTAFFGNFVASINGKNYYPKDCSSAKRIKEENMIWFNSPEEAEADGYAPAKNCP